jgi:hypothetical protein
VLALAGLAGAPGCRRGPRETYVTYFGSRYAVSLRHPAGWSSHPADDGGITYRYFTAPGKMGEKTTPLSASLLATPAAGGFETYAASLVEGAQVTSAKDEQRPGARGKSYLYSKDTRHYGVVLLQEKELAHGLFIQGDERGFREHRRAIEEMMASFTLERPAAYAEHRDARFGFVLRLPPSWRESRKLSNAGSLMMQFLSPAIAEDRDGSTVHVSLTVSSEPLDGGGIEAFYQATRAKLGEAFKVTSHKPWKDGYVDSLTIETPVAMSQARHYYHATKDRGYSLAFEAREDVFYRVSAWCELIASTFERIPSGGA